MVLQLRLAVALLATFFMSCSLQVNVGSTSPGASALVASPDPVAPAVFDVISTVRSISVAGSLHRYELNDGHSYEADAAEVLFEGGPASPFVAGTQDGRRFVGVFMHQDGLPEGCWIAGIGATGTEQVGFVALRGVLWPKSPSSDSSAAPAPSSDYPSSARFCFDGTAHVTGVIY
jgi:hypothetical protein